MAMNNEKSGGAATALPADAMKTMSELWATWLEQSNHQARAVLDTMQSAGDSQGFQKRWLDAVASSLDSFMRTPAFLESMQKNLKAMTDLKVMQDQFLQDTARQLGVPHAMDITGLFERLRAVEQTILRRLDDIEARLNAIERKV